MGCYTVTEYTSLFLDFFHQLVFPCSYQWHQRHSPTSLHLYTCFCGKHLNITSYVRLQNAWAIKGTNVATSKPHLVPLCYITIFGCHSNQLRWLELRQDTCYRCVTYTGNEIIEVKPNSIFIMKSLDVDVG